MNIVNLTRSTVIVPTSRGPWLAEPAAEPAARPAEPEANTLYVVEDFDQYAAVWEPVVIRITPGGIVRPARCAFAF